jgi:hypothetical protein
LQKNKPGRTSPVRGRPVKFPFSGLLPGAGLIAIALTAYANSFNAGFALDNRGLLLEDPRLRAATSENLALIWSHTYWWPYGESGLYRPLTTLSYLFNYAVLGNGGAAGGYHAVNLLLHALNVLLVFALARRVMRELLPAFFTAALWGAHPVLTESVTNIVGRADLLAGTAVVGGLLCYARSAGTVGWRRLAWLISLAVLTALGAFSKESAVVILGVIPLYEWTVGTRNRRALLSGLFAALVPVAAMLWQRSSVLAASSPAVIPYTDNPLVAAPFWTGKLTAIAVLGRYVGLLVWPARLSCDYSYARIPLARGTPAEFAAWAAVTCAIAAAVLFRRNRPVFFFLLFAGLNLAPVSNLLFPIGTIMAERFLYLPAIGFCACLALAVYGAATKFRIPAALAAALLAAVTSAWMVRTVIRNRDWRDDLTLATADLRVSHASFKLHQNRAFALYAADEAHSRLGEAIAEAEEAVAILDSLPDSRNSWWHYRGAGGYYLEQGGRGGPESARAFQRSLELLRRSVFILRSLETSAADARSRNSDYGNEAESLRMMVGAYLRLGRLPQALEAAVRARLLDPLNPLMYWQLFNVLISQDRAEDAAVVLMEGGVATGDSGLRAELLKLYRMGLDRRGCAIVPANGAQTLDPSCPTVHEDLCATSAGLSRLARETPRSDAAEKLRQILTPVPGCSEDARPLL